MWLRFYYMVGMIRHITTVYNAKKDKEALKAKIQWATMFIAKRIRQRISMMFVQKYGIADYINQVKHDMRQEQGEFGSVADIEDFELVEMTVSERFTVMQPFIFKLRIKYSLMTKHMIDGQVEYCRAR